MLYVVFPTCSFDFFRRGWGRPGGGGWASDFVCLGIFLSSCNCTDFSYTDGQMIESECTVSGDIYTWAKYSRARWEIKVKESSSGNRIIKQYYFPLTYNKKTKFSSVHLWKNNYSVLFSLRFCNQQQRKRFNDGSTFVEICMQHAVFLYNEKGKITWVFHQ